MHWEGKTMSNEVSVRWGWLKAMYVLTIIFGGGFGFAALFVPAVVRSQFRFPAQDPASLGLYGSYALAAGLVAILALRSPLKFVPLLFVQLIYKPIWLVVVAMPLFIKGQFPFYIVVNSVIFLTFIIGNLIAIPFSYLFAKK
jgi:hypothetical protein